jgi:predicted permease
MNELLPVLTAVLPVFVIIAAGVILRRIDWLTEEADKSLIKITVNVLTPCLILDSILGNKALNEPGNVFVPPLVGFGCAAMGMMVAYLAAPLAGLREPKLRRTFALCAGLQNYGYVPIPLVDALFDPQTRGVLLVHNVGIDVAMWVLGLALLAGATGGKAWKHLINAPVIAIVVGLVINSIHGYQYIPQFLLETFRILGQCVIPIGVLIVGATAADQMRGMQMRSGGRVMLLGCIVRIALVPLLFLLVARMLPVSDELKRVIVVQAAMPAGMFPIVMVRHYGGDSNTAVRVVLATSLVSFLTIPFVIRAGMEWVLAP